MRDHRSGAAWVPAWTVAVALLAGALHAGLLPLSWWAPAVAAAPAAFGAAAVSFGMDRVAMFPHRVLAVLGAGGWATLVAWSGWTPWRALSLAAGAALVACLEVAVGAMSARGATMELLPADRRPARVRDLEALLRRLTKRQDIAVSEVVPWDNPRDGCQARVSLPEDMTVKELAGYCDTIAGAMQLPQGCVVRALDAEHQGAAVLDVMLRDSLADTRRVEEDTTPASINDEFEVATAPRGESLTVCLRQKSAVVGGTVGSGKTTLLHRIIMRLARCTDTLIWVIDLNGGGVAAPWIGPWARGQAADPVVDWVADNEAEAAVLLAVARAVAKDRKTNRDAIRRKRAANSTVLPVDAEMPAIVIITDEGGEVRQAAGLLGRLVDDGIARVAQIARAEGVRVVMSVLRGTGDLLNKGLRSVIGIRICLRMEEEGEYDHVLGANPGRARLLHVGSAYTYRTDTDHRPVLSRTVDVDLASIDRHAIATATLRPDLDPRGQLVAARITAEDVLGGIDPRRNPDLLELTRTPVMQDVAARRAYARRWDRQAAMLAELRGEDLPEDAGAPVVIPVRAQPTVAPPGSAAEAFLLGTGVVVDEASEAAASPPNGGDVNAEAAVLLSPGHLVLDGGPTAECEPLTARSAILSALRPAAWLTTAEVHALVTAAGCEVSYERVRSLIKQMAVRGEVAESVGRYGQAT